MNSFVLTELCLCLLVVTGFFVPHYLCADGNCGMDCPVRMQRGLEWSRRLKRTNFVLTDLIGRTNRMFSATTSSLFFSLFFFLHSLLFCNFSHCRHILVVAKSFFFFFLSLHSGVEERFPLSDYPCGLHSFGYLWLLLLLCSYLFYPISTEYNLAPIFFAYLFVYVYVFLMGKQDARNQQNSEKPLK